MRSAVLWLILLLLWGCGRETPPAGGKSPPGPDQVLEGSSITFTSQGKKTAVVYADRISKYLKEEREVLQGVRVRFYDKEGEVSSTLTSQEGTVQGERMEAKGEVLVVTTEGVRLETPLLRWDSRANRVYTDSLVKISQGGDVVTGLGMEADPELKQIRIKAQIKGRIEGLDVGEGQ